MSKACTAGMFAKNVNGDVPFFELLLTPFA